MTIDFEQDQQDAMKKTDNIQSLADQVERLETLNERLESLEGHIKNTKSEIQKVSGDIIPTMMSEMGLACLLYTSPSPRDGNVSRMPSSA